MKKVKCAIGHFFDADRFSACPICGAASVAAAPGKEPAVFSSPSHTTPLLTPVGMDDPVPDSASTPFAGNSSSAPPRAPLFPDPKADSSETFAAVVGAPLPDREPPVKAERSQPFEAAYCPNADPLGTASSSPPIGPESPAASLSAAIEATDSKKISALPKTTAYYDFDDVEPPVGWLVCIRGLYAGRAFPCKTGRNRVGRAPGMDICLQDDPSISRDSHAIVIYEPKQHVFFLQSGAGDGLLYHNGSLLFEHAELQAYDKIELGSAEFLFLPLCGEQFTWDEYTKKE